MRRRRSGDSCQRPSTPNAAGRLRTTCADIVAELVDRHAEAGKCHLVADIARQYPVPIISALLGTPRRYWHLFSALADDPAAANRDPEIYDHPERFDITRDPALAMLTFGGGIQYCLGAHLATIELADYRHPRTDQSPSGIHNLRLIRSRHARPSGS